MNWRSSAPGSWSTWAAWDRKIERDAEASRPTALLPRLFVITLPARPRRSDPPRVPRLLALYRCLPAEVRDLADQAYAHLKQDPRHPALHFKRVGRFWSARVGTHYRPLAVEARDGLVRFWIGSHADYDRLLG
jgi:hypothetical protein